MKSLIDTMRLLLENLSLQRRVVTHVPSPLGIKRDWNMVQQIVSALHDFISTRIAVWKVSTTTSKR